MAGAVDEVRRTILLYQRQPLAKRCCVAVALGQHPLAAAINVAVMTILTHSSQAFGKFLNLGKPRSHHYRTRRVDEAPAPMHDDWKPSSPGSRSIG